MVQPFLSCFGLALLLAPLAIGCSSPSGHATAPVQGKVVFNGEPVADATVVFTPESTGGATSAKAAAGVTDAQGRFTLSTFQPNDGAAMGKHRVSVSSGAPPEERVLWNSPPDLVLEVKEGPNDFTIEVAP